jgi:acetyl esterase/lipase
MSFVTHHPLTADDARVTAALRAATAANKGKLRGVAARPIFDTIIGQTIDAPGVTYRPDSVGGVPGWWCTPPNQHPRSVVLHIHGGWFHWGTALAFRALVGHIALRAGTLAFVPDYRLAPEHPFPAGLEDAKACFDGLRAQGFERIALCGDSAGGNLALVLSGLVEAVATAALAPVTDLSLSGESWTSRAEADFYFTRPQAEEMARGYLGGQDPLNPRISPLFGDLSGLPPVRIHVGDQEMLLDDSRRYVERAVAAGVDAEVAIWEGMPHGFAGAVGTLEAAGGALDAIGAFLAGHLASA